MCGSPLTAFPFSTIHMSHVNQNSLPKEEGKEEREASAVRILSRIPNMLYV